MNSDEFAKNFYIEKLMFLKSSFEEEPKHPSARKRQDKRVGAHRCSKRQTQRSD